MAAVTRTISLGGSGGNEHGNVATWVNIAAHVVIAVGQLEPGGSSIALVGSSISGHAMVPGIILRGKEALVASFDEVAGDTERVFGPRIGDDVPLNKAEGGNVEGAAGCLDGAPAAASHGDANEVSDVKGHGEGAAGVKDNREEFFLHGSSGAIKSGVRS